MKTATMIRAAFTSMRLLPLPALLAAGLLFGVFSLSSLPASGDDKRSSLPREEGAVYLEDYLDKELRFKVIQPSPIYSNLTGERWLGNLRPGTTATLLAVSERAFRIRGQAQQGQVAGWVTPKTLEGVNDEFLEKVKKVHERQLIVDDLIKNNQVALGMTIEEVKASLGEPDQKSSKVDKAGRVDTLEYITYERVPQTATGRDAFGRLVRTTVYVKVPTGRVAINFENELVTSIEESEGNPNFNGNIRVVIPPIELF